MFRRLLTFRRGLTAAVGVLLAALALSACGGSSSSSQSTSTEPGGGGESTESQESTESGEGSGSSANAAVAEAEKRVAEATKPQTEWRGPTTSPPGAKDKTVAAISCAPNEGCQRDVDGFIEAAEALGWKVMKIQLKGNVQELQGAVEQALNAGVDGIDVASYPSAAMQNLLGRAEKEGVDVVTMLSGSEAPKPEANFPGGFLTEVGPKPQETGEIAADWVIQSSEGKGQAALLTEEAYPIVVQYMEGFEPTLAKCSECSLTEKISVPIAEVPTAAAPAVSQLLQSNPTTEYLFTYDVAQTYAEQAAKQIGKSVALIGTNANAPNLEALRNGGLQQADIAEPLEFVGWAAADQLNRAFNGEPVAEEWTPEGRGIPIRLLTAENVPPKGEAYKGDIDFAKEFEKLWGVGG